MTDRTRNPQATGANQLPEAIDLTDLHASKPGSVERGRDFDPSNTDLTRASIPLTDVVRLSARPEKREVSIKPSPFTTTEVAQEAQKVKDPSPSRGQRHGILKNPYYPYRGGPLGRLIAFLANILKAIETAVLSLLGANLKTSPSRPPPIQAKPSIEANLKDSKRKRGSRDVQPRRE